MTNIMMWSGPKTQLAPSIIEARQPLGTEIKQHFVEWFSGDALDSLWDSRQVLGSGSTTMQDTIDGGLRVNTSHSANSSRIISFTDKRHYSFTGSVFIGLMKSRMIQTGVSAVGLSGVTTGSSLQVGGDAIYFVNNFNKSFKELTVGSGAAGSNVDTSISTNTNWDQAKGELSSSYGQLHVNGNMEAIVTTTLPDLRLQPYMEARNFGSTSYFGDFRYFEAYNT